MTAIGIADRANAMLSYELWDRQSGNLLGGSPSTNGCGYLANRGLTPAQSGGGGRCRKTSARRAISSAARSLGRAVAAARNPAAAVANRCPR